MTDCTFILNDGLWQCTACGWTYPRQSVKPPRRNCPKGTARPSPPTPRDAVLARYDHAPSPLPIAREEVARRVAVCEGCPHFAKFSCIQAGSDCRKAEHWQQRVLLLDCENWEEPHA